MRDSEGGHPREGRGNDQNGAGGCGRVARGGDCCDSWFGYRLHGQVLQVKTHWGVHLGGVPFPVWIWQFSKKSSKKSKLGNSSSTKPNHSQATTAESWAKCRTGQTQPTRSAYYHNYIAGNVQSPHFPFMSIMLWGHGMQLQPWNMQLSEHKCIHFREPGWGRSTHTAWPMQSAAQPPHASSHPAMKLLVTLGCSPEQRQQLWGQFFWDRIPNLKIAWIFSTG